MKLQEIERRNSDIALMLGYVNTTPTDKDFNIFEYPTKFGEIPKMIETMSMRFHSDWNWLMEAVEFIEKVYNNQPIYFGHKNCVIFSPKTIKSKGKDKKEAVFVAVSDFAQKFNNKEL